MKTQQTIPFSTILASSVHDMKNSLSVILIALTDITEQLKIVDPSNKKISVLRYETNRVNGLMVQLLALYKSEQQQLPLNINYHNVYDFLEEQALSYDELLKSKDIEITIDVEEELDWPFDFDLMAMVVSNIISNSIRYTDSSISIHAVIIEDMLEISISDNGPGYPLQMLENQDDILLGINQNTGSTGLGLYFASQIATMHDSGEVNGSIKLSNNACRGSNFIIKIA